MLVRDVLKTMPSDVVRVGPDETLSDAARAIEAAGKGLAIVCDAEDALLGVISVIDVNRAVARHGDRAPRLPVRELMNPKIVECDCGCTVEEALEKMTSHGIRHLPVVEDGTFRGLVNMRSLLEVRFEQAEIAAEEMRRYVFGIGYH